MVAGRIEWQTRLIRYWREAISSSLIALIWHDVRRVAVALRKRPQKGNASMAIHRSVYREYKLDLERLGPGWMVVIYPPDSAVALADMPSTLDPSRRDAMLSEARAIVDGELDKKI